MNIRTYSKVRSREIVTMFSRSFRWWLWSLAALGVFIGYMGARAQQQEDEKRNAAQAALVRQLEQRKMEEAQRRAAQMEFAERRRAAQAALVAQGAVVRQLWTDEQLEQWVFQPFGNASRARRQLDSLLAMQIVNIDGVCRLTDAQKKKLQLAGRGDIKRFFDRYEGLKRKSQAIEHNEQKLQEILQDIRPLQMTLQAGPFDEDSLLVKSLRNTLTGEQFARYDAMARERRASRHRANILNAVAMLQQGIRLREAQRRELITLITNETKPARRSGPYDSYVFLMFQLGRLPEEKLKRLFDQAQWERVNEQLAQFQQLEPMLRQSGQLPAEEDEAERTDATK